jgi:hypothetical protein
VRKREENYKSEVRRRENDEVEIGDEKRSMIKEKEVMKREE